MKSTVVFKKLLIFVKSASYKYGHLNAEITGIASLNTNSFLRNIGIALLSEICLSAVSKSFVYLSHSLVNCLTSICLNFCEFQYSAILSNCIIPEYIFYLIVKNVFKSLKSLKLVNYVIYNDYSYFLCFLEYSSKFFIFYTKPVSYFADLGISEISDENFSAFNSSLISSASFANLSKDNLIYFLKTSIYFGIWFYIYVIVKDNVADKLES